MIINISVSEDDMKNMRFLNDFCLKTHTIKTCKGHFIKFNIDRDVKYIDNCMNGIQKCIELLDKINQPERLNEKPSSEDAKV